jgi:hypothetical protein
MRLRHVQLILAALLTTAPTISAGEGRRAKTYKTPHAVFDAAKQAAAKDDWKEVFDCLTPKAQDMFTGLLVLIGSQMENLALAEATKNFKDKNEERDAIMRKMIKAVFEPVIKVYAKHGLTEKILKDLGGSEVIALLAPSEHKPDVAKLEKAFARGARSVKDQAGFVSEWLHGWKKVMKTIGKADDSTMIELIPKNARLEDVKVEGDTAKGKMVSTKGGLEKREPVHFQKGAHGWRIELPMDTLTGKKSTKTETKENGARAPARTDDGVGRVGAWSERLLTDCRVDRPRSLVIAGDRERV